MDEHQRKIDLQSPGDLAYLIDNINKAAQAKLDLHLPPSAAQGENDAFRSKVEELVRQYVRQTLALALPSLAINGLDANASILKSETTDANSDPFVIDPNDPSYEPYDTRLAQKLRDLYANLEEETTRVAELRRETPATAASNYVDGIRNEIELSDRAFELQRSKLQTTFDSGIDQVRFKHNDIEESWSRGCEGLEALRNVTKVTADLERALRAVGEVEMG